MLRGFAALPTSLPPRRRVSIPRAAAWRQDAGFRTGAKQNGYYDELIADQLSMDHLFG